MAVVGAYTALVDRLLHHAEIVKIEGDSYRAKEAKQQAAEKARKRAAKRKKTTVRPKKTTERRKNTGDA